jgi:hypothetical protein
MNNDSCKAFKNIWFSDKKIEKINKIYMNLWKYDQISTIQNSLTIKWLKDLKKRFLIWIYHLVLYHILNPNNKFEMGINIIFFHFVMV